MRAAALVLVHLLSGSARAFAPSRARASSRRLALRAVAPPPSVAAVAAAAVAPAALGLWRTGYAVSYARRGVRRRVPAEADPRARI